MNITISITSNSSVANAKFDAWIADDDGALSGHYSTSVDSFVRENITISGTPQFCVGVTLVSSDSDFLGWSINGTNYSSDKSNYDLGAEYAGYKLNTTFLSSGNRAGKPRVDLVIPSNATDVNLTIQALFSVNSQNYIATAIPVDATMGSTGCLAISDCNYLLTATPNPGYTLSHWEYSEDGGESWHKHPGSDGKESHTVTIERDTHFRAVFEPTKLVLQGAPHLYPLPFITAENGISGLNKRTDADGRTYYTIHKIETSNVNTSEKVPVAGNPAALYVQYDSTGTLVLNQPSKNGVKNDNGVDLSYPSDSGGHYIDLALYAGDSSDGEPIINYEDVVLLAPNGSFNDEYVTVTRVGGHIEFQFIMPETEFLTARIQMDNQEPFLATVATGQSAEITALSREFKTLENLKWHYLIDYTLQEATTALKGEENPKEKADIIAGARNAIEGYINGTNKDYITVSFDGNTVRIRDKVSQQVAMMTALEQMYPSGLGFWYLDGNGASAFGIWVNGVGGRMFTANELSTGLLETDIKTPTHEFKAGTSLPKSGLLLGPQRGSLQYGVNGFYANFGITGWRCSDGDRFIWGVGALMSGDDGIPDWNEEGGEEWNLAPDFTGDANVVTAQNLCGVLTSSSTIDQIQAARAAYKAIPATFWNPAYAQYLFRNHAPYKAAYDKLIAAEKGAGIVDPLPTITYDEALTSVLSYIKTSTTAPIVGTQGGEWAILALARGEAMTNDIQAAYLANLTEALESNATGTTEVTDKERITLALTALGINASSYGETPTDLTENYKTYSDGMLVNAATFALLALNSKPYDGDAEEYVEYLLDAQRNDGGWGTGVSDIDTTAMVLQALAPYYRTVSGDAENELTIAVNAALGWLKTKQDDHGNFAGFSSTPSTCSTAQVVTALSALGINPAYEEFGWTKSGGWNPVTALLEHYNEAGWFGESGNTQYDQMATEQAAYALVAYDRLVNGENPLYDMSDAFVESPEPEGITVSFRLIGDTVHDKTEATGYIDWIETTSVTLTGEGPFKVYDAFVKALEDAEMTAELTDENNYVASVTKDGVTLADGVKYPNHGNGSKTSGWKYLVNGEYPGQGLSAQTIEDGDEIVWHYVNDYPAEGNAWTAAYPNIPILQGITVKSAPEKVNYNVGEQFKLRGLTFTADFGNDITADIEYNISESRFVTSLEQNTTLNTPGTQTVTVTYYGKTATFDITVTDSAAGTLEEAKAAKIAQIEEVDDALTEVDYTSESWSVLQTAITAAVQAVNAATTIDELNAVQIPSTSGLVSVGSGEYNILTDTVLNSEISTTLTNALNRLKTKTPNPTFAVTSGEWAIIAMARGEVLENSAKDAYIANVKSYLQTKFPNGGAVKLSTNESTGNSRVIIALAALGIDASNFEGYDLVSLLSDFNYDKNQGINGAIFALIALNTKCSW
jgi:hypothetical protein